MAALALRALCVDAENARLVVAAGALALLPRLMTSRVDAPEEHALALLVTARVLRAAG